MTKDEIRDRMVDVLHEAKRKGHIEIYEEGYGDISWDDMSIEDLADFLLANGVTIQRWIPVSEPPEVYRDECGDFIPFLVCKKGTDYPFRALYDGKRWGDGLWLVEVTHWMPLPQAPKEET